MILPVFVYGHPVLRKVATDFKLKDPSVQQLINDMFETMHHAEGIGLAAPQVGVSHRLFVVDGTDLGDEDPSLANFKKVFLNCHITERIGEISLINEGCLSLPELREEVERPEAIRIEYYDENWEFHNEVFEGFPARIIQHEYDHLEGILFVDKLNPLKRRLLKSKLMAISKGKVRPEYKIKTP